MIKEKIKSIYTLAGVTLLTCVLMYPLQLYMVNNLDFDRHIVFRTGVVLGIIVHAIFSDAV